MTLKQIVVNVPSGLREQLDRLADKALIDRCASFRPGTVLDPTASANMLSEQQPTAGAS